MAWRYGGKLGRCVGPWMSGAAGLAMLLALAPGRVEAAPEPETPDAEAAPVEGKPPAATPPAGEGDVSEGGGEDASPETPEPTEAEPPDGDAEGSPEDGAGTETETEPTEPTEAEPPEPEPVDPDPPETTAEDAEAHGVPVQTSLQRDEGPDPSLRPRPKNRFIYSNLFALRYNPLGLVNDLSIGYRRQLIDKDSVLFRESFAAAYLHAYLSPAFGRIGPRIDIQPLALLNLSATYDFTGYFKTFDLIQSFNSPTAEYSDTELDRLGELGTNYAMTGHFVTLSALLQAKVKNVAVRDNVKFYWSDYDLRAGDTVSYDQTLDIAIPDRGWVVTNDADLLYLFDFGLTLGVRHTLTHAFYQARHFQPAEPITQPNGPTHRIGPAVLYTIFDRPDLRFNKPTLIVLMQWWVQHRYRTGQDVSQAVPYLVIGFRFTGDILPHPNTWNEKTEPKRRKGKRRGAKSR